MGDRPIGGHRIGILYESDEWSDHKLARELQIALADVDSDAYVVPIDMEQPDAIDQALACSALVSRIFASARFRGHRASLERMVQLIPGAESANIPLINPGRAHRFEIDKQVATAALAHAGLATPNVYACASPADLDIATFSFPCVIKPNCGGRGSHTAVLRSETQARDFLDAVPDIDFIVEEFIEPAFGYLTRIEIVDGDVALVVKRSVAPNGLSGYHHGSTYAPYDDCPPALKADAVRAAEALCFIFGSFDVIECPRGAFFIDANSVSNVSEDCTDLLGIDLMKEYAKAIAARAIKP